MKTPIKTYFFLFVFCFLGFACKKENRFDCLKRTGTEISEQRIIANFDTLELHHFFTIYISEDTLNKICIKAGNNLLPLISTQVTNNKLIIKNNNKCNWARAYQSITLSLSAKSLKTILLRGQGDILFTNTIHCSHFRIEGSECISTMKISVDTDTLDFYLSNCTGNYYLSGKTKLFMHYMHGNGYLFANNLQCYDASIISESTGDSYINVTHQLDVFIWRSGNVYCIGKPVIFRSGYNSSGKFYNN